MTIRRDEPKGHALPTRELYCPSHFGNTYECALTNEMTALLSEARFWGFNRFSDWFDTIDLYDVYTGGGGLFNMPEAVWDRKFSNFTCAAELGFELGLVVTPNHVFSDQVTAANAAVKDKHIFGQLVCPSKPGVTEIVLANYRNLFGDFARRGLKLASISGGAYDYGGCACEACQPWIVTFGRLFKQIAELAKEFFRSLDVDLWGWWWRDDDHVRFSEWADREAPGFFNSLAFYLRYGEARYQVRPVPQGCKERGFVHIGYGETRGLDTYTHYGPNIAPGRLEATYRFLAERGADGFLAYSEGDHDDVNKAILGGLSSGQFATADEVLREYARRHFGGDEAGWCELLREMGDLGKMDVGRARALMDRLSPAARQSWRLQALEEKIRMAEADQAARSASRWDPKRIKAAEAFLAAKERSYRGVWRVGLQRHIFRFDTPGYMPDWYEGYLSAIGKAPAYRAERANEEA
ncbi:MAG TPA: hypothetical protein VNA25_01905 [Phycisphaerae bacterium]|nr:hypothetical protein [Phycisphaerae bacterium]